MCLHASKSEPTIKDEEVEVPKLTEKNNGKRFENSNASAASSTSTPTVKTKAPPHVSIAAIVGGMSTQKQRRILDRGIDILVATPGRLWDILENVSICLHYSSLIRPTDFETMDRMTIWQGRSRV